MPYPIFNTSVAMRLDDSHEDETWIYALAFAFIERMALDNASRMASYCTYDEYANFPAGKHGECYVGAPEDVTQCASFDGFQADAINWFKHYVVAHDFHMEITPATNVNDALNNDPEQIRYMEDRAYDLWEACLAKIQMGWEARVRNVEENFPGRFEKVFAGRMTKEQYQATEKEWQHDFEKDPKAYQYRTGTPDNQIRLENPLEMINRDKPESERSLRNQAVREEVARFMAEHQRRRGLA